MIKLSRSALTWAVPDIKVCKTLVLTTRLLYFPLPAFARPSSGVTFKGGCGRWAPRAHSGYREINHASACTHICAHMHEHTPTSALICTHTYTYVYA